MKAPRPTEERPKVNGTRQDEPMVIDLDEDETDATKPVSQPTEFEDEDEEIDPAKPYAKIIRHIDITLGTSVRRIAYPHLPPDFAQAPTGAYPPILSSCIVVAVTCADHSIRLITLPLIPPSPASKDPSTWAMQSVKIFGANTHQDLPSSVTISHTSLPPDSDDEVDRSKSRSRSRNRPAKDPKSTETNSNRKWSFLIASASSTAGGLLLVHQVPLVSETGLSTASEDLYPLQRQYLRGLISTSSLSFNPSAYPAERHSNVLISSPDTGCAKIYQIFSDVSLLHSRSRRDSAATVDSATSGSRSVRGSSSQLGRFLITLYPGFVRQDEASLIPRRKRILDSCWVLGGSAILVLLEDGEWGVWDLEGAGPSSSTTSQTLLRGQSSVSGIQGGALTRFAFGGMISSPRHGATKTPQNETENERSGQLAPMTPHTRKLRSDGLFRGSGLAAAKPLPPCDYVHGSIYVTEHLSPSSSSSSISSADESILLNHGVSNAAISSLLSLWRSETSSKGTFDSLTTIRPFPLATPQLGGEQQRSIAELPRPSTARSNNLFGTRRDTTPDVLITTEHRLIMLVAPISEPPDTASETRPTAEFAARTKGLGVSSQHDDQLLLRPGDLDIDGMDRLLDSMTNGQSKAVDGFGKSVGFSFGQDGDVSMGTPTPKVKTGGSARSRGTPRQSRRDDARDRLFK